MNAIFLQPRMGGLETYVRELLPALLALEKGLEVTVFVTPAGREALASEQWADRVQLVSPRALRLPFTKAITELALVGHLADEAGADVVHSIAMIGPMWSRAASVVTLADVIWLREPDAVPTPTRLLWRTSVPLGARHARRVITLSESARNKIAADLHLAPERIDVVPLGPGTSAAVEPTAEAELRERLGLGGGPIVLTGSAHSPHKNIGVLIEAMAALRERVPEVVLVVPGNASEHSRALQQRAADLHLAGVVVFTGWLPPADLEGLYQTASCFVLPSRREGFGLPLLEAMSRGVPVACARASALPEIAGDAALYFDPDQPGEVADAVGRLLQNPALSDGLRAAGRKRAATFTWERVAEETLTVYERALAE